MDGTAQVGNRARFLHSKQRGCPEWCMECRHDVGPDGAFWHMGPPLTLAVYGESESGPVPLTVRAAFFDKLPEDSGTDPADLELPFVSLEVPADGVELTLTPAQARQLAAALTSAADTLTAEPAISSA